MIDFDFTEHCTGCAACHDVCPMGCIDIITNKWGFLVPKVDKTKCINCEKCTKVCPYLNTHYPEVTRHVYMAYNKDDIERLYGSSGSIMMVLARFVLQKGGVVYGARFNTNLKLFHTRETTMEGVKSLSKSKYIQSNTKGVYKKVAMDIKSGKNVLFVGTPCQTHAIRNFLNNNYNDQLILVDFLCHGVPSQELFDKAILDFEDRYSCKVTNFSFREKTERKFRNYKIWYIKDGIEQSMIGPEDDFPFYCGYLKYYPFRESCYECKFANINRVSDITIGDLWGMEFTGELDDFKKGYSLIYTNNQHGNDILQLVKEKLFLKEFDLADTRTENFTYKKHAIKTKEHKLFKLLYPYLPYRVTQQLFFADKNRRKKIQKIYLQISNSYCRVKSFLNK